MKKFKSTLRIWIALFAFPYILLFSCNNGEKKLSLALEQAGSNKSELIKVIDHYKQNPSDSLKLKAAHFLIENMPFHFSYDTTYLAKYRPVIEKIHSLRAKHLSVEIIKEAVNPMMDSLIAAYPLSYVYSINKSDVTVIKSAYLINSIDQAFDSYNTNPFKDNISFDDFLEYILPYRVANGYSLEEWRPYFTGNYPLGKAQKFTTIHQLSDSLLHNFKEVQFVYQAADQFPYLKLNDYLVSELTQCPQKCWFNCLLLRSFGIPATIDFVPASRIHPPGHDWNALKLKGGLYPIEPFWDDKIRDLKKIYMREADHPNLGPFRFAKIYRKTFKINSTELLRYASSSGEEIPPFFRNPFNKDVTNEYFKTFELKSPILKSIKNLNYVYACVMGTHLEWVPVGFGKIRNEEVLFHSLGSENVYLPAYYKFNSMVPAAYPVLLNKDGSTLILYPDRSHTRKINITHAALPKPDEQASKQAFIGATIEGSNNKKFSQRKILYSFNKLCEPGTYHIPLSSGKKYRYFRLTLPSNKIILNEINFFSKINGREKEIRGKLINSSPKDSLLFKKVIDGDLITDAAFKLIKQDHQPAYKIWLGYYFKHPVAISAFEFYFVLGSNLRKNSMYELLYWDFGWKSLGQKKSNSAANVSFDHVPDHTLLKVKDWANGNHTWIFTYSNGEQHWQ